MRRVLARDARQRHSAVEVVRAALRDAKRAAMPLLKDSRSAFAIEIAHGAHDRIRRWGRAIGEAGPDTAWSG
jgi:hypothetical protein